MANPARQFQTAMQLHRQGSLSEAEAGYRAVIVRDARHFDALHLLGVLKLQQNQAKDAEGFLARAVRQKPKSAEALSNLCAAQFALARYDDALATSRKVLALKPNELGALTSSAVILHRLGRLEEALSACDAVLSQDSRSPDAHVMRGGVLADMGRHDDALESFERALIRNPRQLDAMINRGSCLLQLRRYQAALEACDAALSLAPNHPTVLSNRGLALKNLRQFTTSLASFDRALAVKPDHFDAFCNRGNVLIELQRTDEALESFERALALVPDSADARCGAATALIMLGRHEEALGHLDKVLTADPLHHNGLVFRGTALRKLDRDAEAIEAFERLARLDVDHPFKEDAYIETCLVACDWGRTRSFPIADLIAGGAPAIRPLTAFYFPLDPQLHRVCSTSFARQTLPDQTPRWPDRAPRQGDRIRIAYVSGDFRVHPVGLLTAELYELHDRSRFEVVGVSLGQDDGSAIAARLRAGFDRVLEVASVDDLDVARLLRQQAIDIAIDLRGHTELARLGIFAARAAPVQVGYLGYPGTTGLDAMDYILADRHIAPFEERDRFSEKIVQLPGSYQVNDSKRAVSERAWSRHEAGLPEHAFVFCGFNNAAKINPTMFDVWMRLLAGVPESVLWLNVGSSLAADNLRREAAARGVSPDRLVFASRTSDLADHLARHRLADLFLDTLPYNAHATGSDALWAGVPVLTCRGDNLAGRVGASLVHAAGLPALVTETMADYEALALKLAQEPPLLQSIRARLNAGRTTCALFDSARWCRNVEAAYTTMYETWRRGEPPREFAVEPVG